jgi:hypothetical protein
VCLIHKRVQQISKADLQMTANVWGAHPGPEELFAQLNHIVQMQAGSYMNVLSHNFWGWLVV